MSDARPAGKPAPLAAREPSRPELVALMCAVSFATIALIGIAVPILPRAVARLDLAFASADLVVGGLMSSFPAAMLIGGPVAKGAAARLGRYPLLAAGLVLMCAGTVVFALAPALGAAGAPTPAHAGLPTVLLLLGARATQGLGAVCANNASFAIVLTEFSARLGTVMGLNEVTIGVAATAAPMLGAALYLLGGFALPLLAGAALVCAISPLVGAAASRQRAIDARTARAAREEAAAAADFMRGTLVVASPRAALAERAEPADGARAAERPRACLPRGLSSGALWLALGGIALAMAIFGVLNGILILHLLRIGLDELRCGVTYGLYSAAYALTSPAAGWAADRWGGCCATRARTAPHGAPRAFQDMMTLGLALAGLAALGMAAVGPALAGTRASVHAQWSLYLGLLCALGAGQATALTPSLPAVRAAVPPPLLARPDVLEAVVTLNNMAMQIGCARARPQARPPRPNRPRPLAPSVCAVLRRAVRRAVRRLALGPVLGGLLASALSFEGAVGAVGALALVYSAVAAGARGVAHARGRSGAAAVEPADERTGGAPEPALPPRHLARQATSFITPYGTLTMPPAPPDASVRWAQLRASSFMLAAHMARQRADAERAAAAGARSSAADDEHAAGPLQTMVSVLRRSRRSSAESAGGRAGRAAEGLQAAPSPKTPSSVVASSSGKRQRVGSGRAADADGVEARAHGGAASWPPMHVDDCDYGDDGDDRPSKQ